MMALLAGAATADITPRRPMFLYGYPHVPRISTGVHDPLLASALCLERDGKACLFLACDVLFIGKETTGRVRGRIADATGLRPDHMLLSATHTHSGPVTLNYLSNEGDAIVPPVDPEYLRYMEEGMVRAAVQAWQCRRSAETGFARADATGIGTNRHDPAGPSDPSVPVLSVRETTTHRPIALLLVCAMHPTVLHEDSTLISGDFPALARRHLQENVPGMDCPILHHTGASGNQSPRHVTRENTFAEARRLGRVLAEAVERTMKDMRYDQPSDIDAGQVFVDLPARRPPTEQDARRLLLEARRRLDALRESGAAATAIRTAECDWFGAEESLAIAKAAAEGRLQQALQCCLPAEIQVLRIGDHLFVGWPGELFVEFALAVTRECPRASIITLANGDLQGYVVTHEAVALRYYEASNALLRSPDAGDIIVGATLDLLKRMHADHG